MSTQRNRKAPTIEPRRCAIYTRKSTAHGLDQEFNSLDAQREACLAYIQSQPGWVVAPERYDDGGWSGGTLDRPAFQRLLHDVRDGRINVVVAYKLDRLSRSLRDFARLMDLFEHHDVAFVSVTQQFNTADAMGRLTLNMLMSFAEFEREMARERTRDKVAASKKRGKWTGGRLPYGYRSVDKKLVSHEHEAVVVREIFSLYEQHRSALAIAQVLNQRGGTGRRWSNVSVLRVLKNPIYAGQVRGGDELHEGEHQPTIDREQFSRVQATIAAQAGNTTDRGRNPDYILRGLLRCALCGGAMTPASSRGRDRRVYRYYRCVTRDKHGRKACPARPLPAGNIEGFVVAKIREAARDGALSADMSRDFLARLEHQRQVLVAQRGALAADLAALSAEGSRMAQSLASANGGTRRVVEARIAELGIELERCETTLAEVERKLARLDQAEADARWVAGVLADFDAAWELMTAENRGRLIRALVQRVEVDEPSGAVTITLVDLGLDGEPGDPAAPESSHASLGGCR